MIERSYTLSEIDQMRIRVEWLMRTQIGGGMWRVPSPVDVEARLRTYMAGGIGVDDLPCVQAVGQQND